MKYLSAFLLLVSSVSFGSSATSIFDDVTFSRPVCFGHVYSKSELSKRPAQTVSRLKASLIKYSADPSMESRGLKLELSLLGEPRSRYHAEFSCFENGGRMTCAIECDGGSVTLVKRTNDSLLIKSNGFMIRGGCDDQTEELVKRLEAKPAGDDLFKLEAQACLK